MQNKQTSKNSKVFGKVTAYACLVLFLVIVYMIIANTLGGKDKAEEHVDPEKLTRTEQFQVDFSSTHDPEGLFEIFDDSKANENFRSLDKILPYNVIETEYDRPQDGLIVGETVNTKEVEYTFLDTTSRVSDLLEKTNTHAYMVVQDSKIVDSYYVDGYSEKTHVTSWSVAKSFLSTLVGIALQEGKIASLDDLVTVYAPELSGSGYEGVTIRNVLEMASGVGFNEDYTDPESDLLALIPYLVLEEGSVDTFTGTLKNAQPIGTHYYKSIDTQVLGMIIKGATGKPASKYLEEKIWKPLGMSSNAYWSKDLSGDEISFAMLNATPVDYAKFGLLLLNDGNYLTKQIIPTEWIKESVTPSREDLKEGVADPYFGYGFQWWIPYGAEYGEEFAAMGIYGQYIYVNKTTNTVIVKFSADPMIIMNDAETIEALRAVATELSASK